MLSVRGLRLRPDGRPIDLEVRAGELVGLAGLEGHGGDTFLEALRGGIETEGEVVRHVDGREVVIRIPADAADHDIAYVPRERRLDSVFSWMSIRENFALPTLDRDSRFGLIRTALLAAPARAPTSTGSASCSAPPSTRSRRSPAATSRR